MTIVLLQGLVSFSPNSDSLIQEIKQVFFTYNYFWFIRILLSEMLFPNKFNAHKILDLVQFTVKCYCNWVFPKMDKHDRRPVAKRLNFILFYCPTTHLHHLGKEILTNNIEYNEPNGKKTRLKYLSVLLSFICYRLIVDPLIHNYFYSICLLSSFIFFSRQWSFYRRIKIC